MVPPHLIHHRPVNGHWQRARAATHEINPIRDQIRRSRDARLYQKHILLIGKQRYARGRSPFARFWRMSPRAYDDRACLLFSAADVNGNSGTSIQWKMRF